jgi:hypothetical protein
VAEIRCTGGTRNAMLDAVVARMSLGPGVPSIEFRAAPRPTKPDAVSAGALIAVLECSTPLADPAAAGATEFIGLGSEVRVIESGKITWAIFRNGAGETVFDCDVSATNGDGAIELSSVDAVVDDLLRLTSFSLVA